MFPGAALILVILALLVPVFFVLTWLISAYHRLAALSKVYIQAYAPLETELKRRYDLILALIETAKGWLAQDAGTPEAILAARNAASGASLRAARAPGDAPAMRDLGAAESALRGTLRRLFTLAKEYPELNTDQAMLRLRAELGACDEAIASAGQTYNDAVMKYDLVRGSFPHNVVAIPFGFAHAEPFHARHPNAAEAQEP